MNDQEEWARARLKLDEWRAAMVSKGIPRMGTATKRRMHWRRWVAIKVARTRLALGCWIAGRDLDDW